MTKIMAVLLMVLTLMPNAFAGGFIGGKLGSCLKSTWQEPFVCGRIDHTTATQEEKDAFAVCVFKKKQACCDVYKPGKVWHQGSDTCK